MFSFGRAAEGVPRDVSGRVLLRLGAGWLRLGCAAREVVGREVAGREVVVRELGRELPGALAAPVVRFSAPERLARLLLEWSHGEGADEAGMRIKVALTHEEIAQIMNCPIGTVRSRIFRAREAVAEKLRPQLGTSKDKRW